MSSIMRTNRWLSSGAALAVAVVMLLSSLVFGGVSLWQSAAADRLVNEQGWLRLSRARLEVLQAAHQMSDDLDEGTAVDEALATFDAKRDTVEATVTDLVKVDPDLAFPVESLHDALRIVPRSGPVSAERLMVVSTQLATRLGQLSQQAPLQGELGFADRVAVDLYRLQLAHRLVALTAPDGTGVASSTDAFALGIAADLSTSADDQIWRVVTTASTGDVPEAESDNLSALATSDDARILQDGARWAAAQAGVGSIDAAGEPPSAKRFGAADDRVADQMLELGMNSIAAQGGVLRSDQGSAETVVLITLYLFIGTMATGIILLLLRRNRSRISDDELRVAASTDRLTGLGNRAHLDAEVALLSERSPEVVLMHIDLDHFKPVNDTYGHAVGDRVLQLSADRLRAAAEEHDGVAARLGGDEFVLVLPSVSSEVVDHVTSKLLAGLQAFQIGGLDLTVGASIGVARGVGEVTDLLINADLALYQAKRTGRGQASTFRAEAAAFVSFVRDALIEGRVQVVYQPQVSLRDGRCVGAEVLARLVDDTGMLIPAGEWLGIAEWLGVTGELFEHVVSAVSDDLAVGPPLQTRLWFNVAPNDLIRPGGPEWMLNQLARLKLPPARLGIELTETEAITDPGRLAVVLERLRSVGIGLALDDFGARNTPLGHLVDLPVSRVKLDASLIAGIGPDMPPSSWVVKAMAELAARLRIEVVAEGVTSGQQMTLLAKLGVPAVQGYLLGLPGPIERIPAGVDLAGLVNSSLAGMEPTATVGPLVQTASRRSTDPGRRPVSR